MCSAMEARYGAFFKTRTFDFNSLKNKSFVTPAVSFFPVWSCSALCKHHVKAKGSILHPKSKTILVGEASGSRQIDIKFMAACIDCIVILLDLCTSQIEASTSPPRATPGHLYFLQNFCSNSPLPRPKSCSNAPTPGKLFGSFYYAPEAVYANMV